MQPTSIQHTLVPVPDTILPVHKITSPLPPQPSHPLPSICDTNTFIDKFSNSFVMPPIHPGLYPSPLSHLLPPYNPSSATPHDIVPYPSPYSIHPDFVSMEDLVEYYELCYTVDQQLKYDKLHPLPLIIPENAPHHNLPDHQAYILLAYSKHVAQNPLVTPSPMEYEYDPSSLAADDNTPILILDEVVDHEDAAIPIAIDDKPTHDVPILPSTSLPSRLLPTIRPIDTANASLPIKMSKNWDLMQKLVGFMNMNLVLKPLDTIVVQNLERNQILDRGR